MMRCWIAAAVLFAGCAGDGEEAAPSDTAVDARCPGGLPDATCAFETEDERADAMAETERLAEIQDRHEDEVMGIDGVVSMGIGYDCDAEAFVFRVGYDEDGHCPDAVPAELEGVPVQLFPMGPVVPL